MINAEGPPVPIPNTEVKLCRAENTWLETAREDRYSPTRTSEVRLSSDLVLFLPNLPVHVQTRFRFSHTKSHVQSSIAQSVEHLTVNQGVTGSSPVGGAKDLRSRGSFFFYFGVIL